MKEEERKTCMLCMRKEAIENEIYCETCLKQVQRYQGRRGRK